MVKLILILLLLPIMAKAQFIKDDKLKHKLVSHTIVQGGGYAMYKATNRAGLSIATSIAASLLTGYFKESYDKSQGREFSKDDIGANINGILVGAICLAVTINLNQIKIHNKEQKLRLY